jgi:hypothetical protein
MPGRNGRHRPPRPSLEITAPSASPDEAAAIAAALERFLVETAPPPEPTERVGRWQRAALHEAIGARQIEPSGWGQSAGR